MEDLQEAYLSIYESRVADRARNAVLDAELDAEQSRTQASIDRMKKRPKVTRASAALASRRVESDVKKAASYAPQQYPKPGKAGAYRIGEEIDSYDIVLDYLLDEGFADSEENAITIMANMSEEWIDDILDEAWREPKRRDESTPSGRAVHRHLDKSGSTRNPSPANLAHREIQARRLENRADNIEKTRDFTNAYYRTGAWKSTSKENAPKSNPKDQETSSNLRSRAKAIRAVTRAQTRRSSTDVDNQRIANSVRTQAYKNAIARVDAESGNRETPKANFDRATSHLDLSKVDPDTYGKSRRTTPKSPKKPKTQSNRSPKPKQIAKNNIRQSNTKLKQIPKNNIRQFNREELECIFHYILTEGYCSTEENAIFMMENMSDKWKTNILNSI